MTKKQKHGAPTPGSGLPREIAGLPRLRYLMLLIGVAAQVFTFLITWPIWQVRTGGIPNLPLLPFPQIDFGLWAILSTLLILVIPRKGIWVNLAVLVVATLFDQVRVQPQILANWMLMMAAVIPAGPQIVRLFLASLWIWAGLHKLVSPEWMTYRSWNFVRLSGFEPDSIHVLFAYTVALSEIGLGVISLMRPRWAMVACPLLHVGIAISLSPLFRDWNYSVIPWNLATAIVGSWIHFEVAKREAPIPKWEYALGAAMLIYPAGFYAGWIDHGYAHVLYSGGVPQAVITRSDGSFEEIHGWGELAAPFPDERRMFRQYFATTASPGEKLHLHDSRPWLSDQFLQMTLRGPQPISKEEFYRAGNDSPPGVGYDSKRSIFLLTRAKADLLVRREGGKIYAVQILPENYTPELLDAVAQLPNVEQIQLSGTAVTDDDLKRLQGLFRLEAIGLNDTKVTREGIESLRSLPSMKTIQSDFSL